MKIKPAAEKKSTHNVVDIIKNKALHIKAPYINEKVIMNDAIDRITTILYQAKEKKEVRSILITGCEPSTGVTTIALDLAMAIADSNRKVIFVDADLKKQAAEQGKQQKKEYGLSDYLYGAVSLERILIDTEHKSLKRIFAGNVKKDPTQLLSSELFQRAAESLATQADFVIYDSPSIGTAADAKILSASVNGVILVAKYGSTTTEHVKTAKREFEAMGSNILGIILNRMPKKEYKRIYPQL